MTDKEFRAAVRDLLGSPVDDLSASDKAEAVRQVLAEAEGGTPPQAGAGRSAPWRFADSRWFDLLGMALIMLVVVLAARLLEGWSVWLQVPIMLVAGCSVWIFLFLTFGTPTPGK